MADHEPQSSTEGLRTRLVVEALRDMEPEAFSGTTFCVTRIDADPLRGVTGGRWSPGLKRRILVSSVSPGASREDFVARALDPVPEAVPLVLHELDVRAARVLRLTTPVRIERLGLQSAALNDEARTSRVAFVAYCLGFQGLLVPSQTPSLVAFLDNLQSGDIQIVASKFADR